MRLFRKRHHKMTPLDQINHAKIRQLAARQNHPEVQKQMQEILAIYDAWKARDEDSR